jgi:hypothetical protein
VSDTGYIAAQAAAVAAKSTIVMATTVVPVTMIVMVVRVVPVVVVISPTIAPVWIPTPVIAVVVRIAPIPIPAPIAAPIGTITPTVIVCRVVVPIEGIIAVYIDVRIASSSVSVIVIIIVSRCGGWCAETLDACGEVSIVIRLRSSINYTVGVGHRLRGLVYGISIVDVILAVGIVSLVVVFRVAADAGAHIRAVTGGHLTSWVAIRRIIGIIFSCLAIC